MKVYSVVVKNIFDVLTRTHLNFNFSFVCTSQQRSIASISIPITPVVSMERVDLHLHAMTFESILREGEAEISQRQCENPIFRQRMTNFPLIIHHSNDFHTSSTRIDNQNQMMSVKIWGRLFCNVTYSIGI